MTYTRLHQERLAQKALRQCLVDLDWKEDETFAVSLTMKQHHEGFVLDDINAPTQLHHFLNRLNYSYFGNAFKRYGKRMLVISSLEKSWSGRWHYHLTIQNPRPERKTLFLRRIQSCWSYVAFGDKEIDAQPAYYVNGWNDYITKRHSIFDCQNTYWGNS